LWKFHRNESFRGVEIILATFVDNSEEIVFGRSLVGQGDIYLVNFE
jgi:hypothetical protein